MNIPTYVEIQRSVQDRIHRVKSTGDLPQQGQRHCLKLVSCRANPDLSREISDLLEEPLVNIEIKDFADGETYVRLHESVRESDVFVIQSTCRPVINNYGELFIVNDAISRSSPHRLVNFLSYYGFARQDRKTSGREAVSAKLFARLLETSGNGELRRLFVFEPHFPQLPGYFDTPKVDIGFATPLFLAWVRELQLQVGEENVVLVSPDVGGVTRVRVYAKILRNPYAIVDKWRAEHNKAEVMNVIGDVEGKIAVVVDDMIDTAGTICEVSRVLMERGARSVHVLATHPLLSGPAFERLEQAPIETVVVTNTVPLRPEKQRPFSKIQVLSVAPLLANFILNTYLGEKISPLLGYDD